jgi:hypothetical protein
VVFLDPEVESKTCPNCGMPVRQYALPVREATLEPVKKKAKRPVSRKTLWVFGAVALFLAIVAALAWINATKSAALLQAAASAREAEDAEQGGNLNTAAAGYSRAISIYQTWRSTPEIVKPLQAKLERVETSLAKAAADAARNPAANALLSISLEELARQAYAGPPETFQGTFSRDYAGRVTIVQGKVEEGEGRAYKASSLRISYKVFSPTGDAVELSFDAPFFERYRLKPGAACIVRAVLAKMYIDAGAPGQSGHWVLVFDGTKSSLVTDTDQLKGLGWKVDDEIADLIGTQRSLSPSY